MSDATLTSSNNNNSNDKINKADSLNTTPRKAGDGPLSGSGCLSPSDGLFAAFPIQSLAAKPEAHGTSRRASSVSFNVHDPTSNPSGAVRGGDISPGARNLESPSNGGGHSHHNNPYRSARDAFYHHFEVDPKTCSSPNSPNPKGAPRDAAGSSTDVVRCHQLASVALGLSYLLAELEHTKGKFPNLRVTHEDIITTLRLPLSYTSHNHITFHELFAITEAFVKADVRFRDYVVKATTFDTKRAESTPAQTIVEEETSRRTSVLTATELRSVISDDGLCFDRVRIACYDGEIVSSEHVIEVEEGELDKNELLSNVLGDGVRVVSGDDKELRRRPQTHSACAVIADIHRTLNSVQLLPIVSVEPLKTRRLDVPLKTLLDALCVRNPDSLRAQGLIEIVKRGSCADKSAEGVLGISLGVIGEAGITKLLASDAATQDREVTSFDNIFGFEWQDNVSVSATNSLLAHCDYTVAGHILCTATAMHLLNPKRFPAIGVNSLVSELKLMTNQIILGSTVHPQQWYPYLQYAAEKNDVATAYVPFARQSKKPGSAPFVSVGTLLSIIKSSTGGAARGKVLLMVAFDGNKGRQTVNYTPPGDTDISYAIIAGFDEESESVLMLDCDVKRNAVHWVTTVDSLHCAMIDNGMFLLADKTEDGSLEALNELLPELDAFTKQLQRIPAYLPCSKQTFGPAESAGCATPLALLTVAAARLGVDASVDDFVVNSPCHVSHLLFPHISLFDLARLFNTLCRSRSLPLHATAVSLGTDRAMHRKSSLPSFAATLKSLVEDETCQVLVNFSRYLLPYAPSTAGMACPNYALVLAMPTSDTVVLCDTNKSAQERRFQVSVSELFKACEDMCPLSRRAKGYLVVSKEASAKIESDKQSTAVLGDLHFKTLHAHAFRPSGSPQLQAVAMAFTALGFPSDATAIFHSALEKGGERLTGILLPLSGLRRRFTVAAIVEVASVYAKECLGAALEVSTVAGSSRSGHTTRDDIKTLLSSPRAADEVVVCVYDVRNAYDVPLEFVSAGVVAGVTEATGEGTEPELTVINAEPSSWGEFWRSPLHFAVECIQRDPDDSEREKYGVLRVRRSSAQKK